MEDHGSTGTPWLPTRYSQCFVSAPKIGDLFIVTILGHDLEMKVMLGFDHVFGGKKKKKESSSN